GLPFDIDNLPEGDYELILTDANGCTGTINTEVWSPEGITIDLEPAHTIQPGDSVLLDPQIQSAGITTYSWTPTTYLQTPGALQTYAKPEETTEYTLVVQDNAGCIGEATVLITLEEVKRVFIPNVLLIDSGDNGFFTVYGGSEVARVTLMQVYDRWGALMYEGTNLAPNNPGNGWDGFWKNKPVQPGVYPYIIEVEYQTGETEVFTGGLTVVR
ncbi:MAG: gliding motility-associated C-terminal domain-containing protein, partial [Saprospiraceae bacterium]